MTGMRLTDGAVCVRAAVLAMSVNIAVHAALTPMHLSETPYIGVLFIVGNVALIAAIGLLSREPWRQAGWLLGGATSVAQIAAFLASRTVGLPQGYKENWAVTTENMLGWLCLAVELATVITAFVSLSASATRVAAANASAQLVGAAR